MTVKVHINPLRSLFTQSVDSGFLAGALQPVLESPRRLEVLLGLGLLLAGCGVADAWLFPL